MEEGEQIVVGVNAFDVEDSPAIPTLRVGPEVEERQVENLRKVRASRNQKKWAESLERLEQASRGKENVMPLVLEAVKAYASVGEICDVWREVFGVYRAPVEF